MRIRNYLLVAWIILPLAGCASMTDSTYEMTQMLRAGSAWKCVPDCAKNHRYPHDYQSGWKDGYYDVLTGGNGCPPLIAPECYWKPKQILEDCDNRRHAYYDGFQDGAAAALRQPDTHHLKMWSSCECPLPTCEPCCPEQLPCSTCPMPSVGMPVHAVSENQGMIEPNDPSALESKTDALTESNEPKPTRIASPAFPVAAASNNAPIVQSASPLRDIGLLEVDSNESISQPAESKPVPTRPKYEKPAPQASQSTPDPAKATASKTTAQGSLIRVAAPIHPAEPNDSFIKYASELNIESAE